MTDDEKLAAWVERALADDAASTPISAPPAPRIDLEAIRDRLAVARKFSLGDYYPAAESDLAALCGEVERLTKKLWECPDCAFAFDAIHENGSCPVCELTAAESEIAALRAVVEAVEAQQFHSDAPTPRRIQEAYEKFRAGSQGEGATYG